MSITFSVKGISKQVVYVPCDFYGCCDENRCGYCQDGVEITYVSEAPELNVANVTARILLNKVLNAVEMCQDMFGEIELSDIPACRRNILIYLNRPSLLNKISVEPSEYKWDNGCNVFDCGISEERIINRLKELDSVLEYAQKKNCNVQYG